MHKWLTPGVLRLRTERALDVHELIVFSTRSLRAGAPVFICAVPIAATKSAMNEAAVSPLRCVTTVVQPADFAPLMAAMVTVTVPIWFNLMSTELAICSVIPHSM